MFVGWKRRCSIAQSTKEQWCEAELYRTEGELVLVSREADVATAEAHFERALEIARQQHSKS
jgi:predicted ATPase